MRKYFVIIVLLVLPFISFSQANTITEEQPVFLVVEEMPVYPGGDEAMRQFLVSNIIYPQIAKENNIQGKVFVEFIIEKTGDVTNVKVIRGVDPLLDDEAVRVVKLFPKWTPGKQEGKLVRVRFIVPIIFKLDTEKEGKKEKK